MKIKALLSLHFRKALLSPCGQQTPLYMFKLCPKAAHRNENHYML